LDEYGEFHCLDMFEYTQGHVHLSQKSSQITSIFNLFYFVPEVVVDAYGSFQRSPGLRFELGKMKK